MLDNNLKIDINLLWNKFWSGGISDPLVAITQMSYLIFMKRLEDEEIKREQEVQLSGEAYVSLFKEHPEFKWSEWTNLPANKILDHVRDKVFPFLRNLGGENSLYAQYMKDAVFTIPTASLLIEAVKIIDDMHMKEQNKDAKGDLYEYLLSALKTAGINGQFRTPRHIIRMMVSLVDPKIGDKICDPACGTAGFLVCAYEHILKEKTSKEFIQIDEFGVEHGFKGDKLDLKQWSMLWENSLYGYDFDPTMVRLSLMNLMMHGINNPNIKQKNTLSSRYNQEKNHYDIVLANPPFKGSINQAELSNEFSITTTKTEILFLELMYNILASGGKCAVIVPEGVLFGGSNAYKRIRQKLLEECRLDAVVSMPSGVFKPYAGVSTAAIVFTKGEPTKKVWFYEMKSDGFSLDDKRTFIDGKGNIPDIIAKFKQIESEKFEDRKASCFNVPIDEIKANNYDLSVSKYKEIQYQEITYEDPEIIKQKIVDLENKIIKTLKEIPTDTLFNKE